MLVSACIIFTTIFVPVSAVTVSKNIAVGQTVTITNSSNNTVNFSGYGGAQAVDGNDATISLITGISNFSSGYNTHGATLMVVELDKAYPVTKIEAVPAARDDALAAVTALGFSPLVNVPDANWNGAAHIYVSNEALTLDNLTTTGTKLSQYNSLGTQSTFNLDGVTEYKYVAVHVPSATYPCALKDLRIWADVEKDEVEEEPTDKIIVNKTVTKDATAELYQRTTLFNNAGYEAEKMLDGDSSTFAYGKISGYSGHLAVVDLGAEYDITKILLNFPEESEVQTAITALSTPEKAFNAAAGDANIRTVVVLSNTKPATSMFSGLNYTGAGKIVYNANTKLSNPATFEDSQIEDENDYRYIGIWTPYSYGLAVSEINVWADVEVDSYEPMAMHFSKTEALTGEAETEFGIGQLYYNGRIVNDTDEAKTYTSFIVSYKDDILEYVDVEKVTVDANGYKDVSIPVYQKIGMDKIRGYMWEGNNAPLGKPSEVTKKDNGYDPLFDGTILTMNPTVYDATEVIEEYNKTAETPLPLTGISEFENVDTIFFDGIEYKGETKKAFAYVAIPEGASADNPVPGVVLVHGGGGTAYDRWAKAWADKGYAAISIDTEGRINTKTNTYSNSGRMFSGMGHQNNMGYGDFTADESKHSDMWFYQAASDAILAGNVLRNLPEVDENKIGITGISYGSMITMKAIGADNRFSFAAPVYGCGYGWESPTYWQYNMTEERKAWDPIMFLKQTGDMPILWFATNRDCNFALEELSKTYTDEDVFNKANIVILDNYSHTEELGSIIDTTLDPSKYYLNAERQQQMTDAMIEFAKVAFGQEAKGLSKVSRLNYENGKITATVTLPDGVSAEGGKAIFRYVTVADYDDLYKNNASGTSTSWLLKADGTVGTENSYNSPWPKVDAEVNGTTITVNVPQNATYGFIDYIDSRNILTSSEMIKIK